MRRHLKAVGWSSGRRAVIAAGLLIIALSIAVVAQALAAKGVVRALGTSAAGETGGLFRTPRGVAVDTAGNGAAAGTVYVVDSGNNRVQRFSSAGTFESAFGADVGGTSTNLCTDAANCVRGTPGAAAGQFGSNGAQGIAVEATHGNLFITDQRNRRVDVYSAAGAFEGAFGWKVEEGAAGEEKLQFCTATTGCQAGSAGAGAGQFGSAIGYPTFDPSTGNLYVADKTNRRVDEFEPVLTAGEVTGVNFVRGYGWGAEDGSSEFQVCTTTCHAPAASGSGLGQFATNGPSQLGVGSAGNVYALDPGNSRVQKFSGTGTPLEASFASAQLGGSPAPADLYVDPAPGGHIFADKSDGSEVRTLELSGTGALIEAHDSGAGLRSTTGLSLDPGSGNIYVSTGNHVLVLNTPLVAPDAAIDPVTAFTATTAQLSGAVTPNGFETGYHFEVTPEGGAPIKVPATDAEAGAGGAPVPVSQEVTGLLPNTLYHVTLVATKPLDAGSATSSQVSFMTTPEAFATGVEAREATLGADVNPIGSTTTYQFQYVDDAHYKPGESNPYAEGQVAPAAPAKASGAGNTSVAVSRRIAGLTPGTTYHYRVVATTGAGTSASPDQTIATPAVGDLSFTLPDNRAWEQVSPVFKEGGGTIQAGNLWIEQAAADGNAFTYGSFGAPIMNGEGNRAPDPEQYLGRHVRGGGWQATDINPPQATTATVCICSEFRIFSEDLSLAGAEPRGQRANGPSILSSEASERTSFLREDFTQPARWRPLATSKPGFVNVPPGTVFGGEPESQLLDTFSLPVHIEGGSPDLHHVVVKSEAPLTTDAEGVEHALYEWTDGSFELVSRLPVSEGGEAVVGQLGSAQSGNSPAQSIRHAASEDGRYVFFGGGGFAGREALYVRDTVAGETARLDAVQPGASGAGRALPVFQAASVDGSDAFFTDTQQLTPGASVKESDLYVCEVVQEAGETKCHLQDLTPESSGMPSEVQAVVSGVDAAGDTVYFVANGVLAGGAAPGNCNGTASAERACNLYVAHEEGGNWTTTFIARLSSLDSPDWGEGRGSGESTADLASAVSPSGRYFAFMSLRRLTGYDNTDVASGEADEETFLYDSVKDELSCVSCRLSGARPSGGTPAILIRRPIDPLEIWAGGGNEEAWIAAVLPDPTKANGVNAAVPHAPRSVVDNGRVFFNAFDSLVRGDSNHNVDAYMYEPWGVGSCTTASVNAGTAQAEGGCVSLLTAGTAETESTVIDASASGNDAFLLTRSRLSPLDEDAAYDIYDARVDGVPAQRELAAECQGEACQAAVSPPNDPTPASSSFQGPGNQREGAKPRCAKGKRKVRRGGKTRCVAAHHARRRHRAHRRHHRRHHRKHRANRKRRGVAQKHQARKPRRAEHGRRAAR